MELDLRELLKAHNQHSGRDALKNNFGDGYLLCHNRIYRGVRKALKKAGFRLSSTRFGDYETLPLSQLPAILRDRVIPYSDNVSPLRAIEKLAPGAFTWTEVPPLKSNTLLHESAHGVARAFREQVFGPAPKLPLSRAVSEKKKREVILGALMEESFANTCECLSNLDAHDRIHDEFLHKNSYIMESPRDRAVLREARELLGDRVLFRLLWVSYLHSNFLKVKWDGDLAGRALRFAGVGSRARASVVRGVIRIGLNLDPAFTQFTGSFCFRLMGIRGGIFEFLDFDFMAMLEDEPRYGKWLDALSGVVVESGS